MWLVKGIFIGGGIFILFSAFRLYRIFSRFPKVPQGTTTTIDIRSFHGFISPLSFMAFFLIVAAACVCMKLLQRT